MRIHEILTELLTSPRSWKVVVSNHYIYRAEFSAGDRMIRVEFGRLSAVDDEWDSSFEERSPSSSPTMALTGSGDEFKVFATVVAIYQEFLATHKVSALTFSAAKRDRNRARLYERLARRLAGNSWNVTVDNTGDNAVAFTLTPKQE